MPDHDSSEPITTSQASVPALADDYRRQQEAWRVQAAQLARMRAEVLMAAEREAASVVTTARAEIRNIIVTARRELLGLAKQIEALPTPQEEWPARPGLPAGSTNADSPDIAAGGSSVAEDTARAANRLLDARHALTQVLAEAQPDIHRMQDEATGVHPYVQPPVVVQPPHDIPQELGPAGHDAPVPSDDLRLKAEPPTATLAAEVAIDEPARPRSVIIRVVAVVIVVLIAILLLAAAFWSGWIGKLASGPQKPAATVTGRPAMPPPSNAVTALDVASAGRTRPPAAAGAPPATIAPTPIAASRATPPPSADTKGVNLPPADSATPRPPSAPAFERSDRASASVSAMSPEATAESRTAITSAAERWLDAYYQHDSARMASAAARELKISDQRDAGERPPAGQQHLSRTLEQVRFQFVGDSAILTAKMNEQADAADGPRRFLCWISQVWLREGGQWRLMEARIISDAKLR